MEDKTSAPAIRRFVRIAWWKCHAWLFCLAVTSSGTPRGHGEFPIVPPLP
jgi:hypothetical protein